jgi:hypothetical protein
MLVSSLHGFFAIDDLNWIEISLLAREEMECESCRLMSTLAHLVILIFNLRLSIMNYT